MLSLLHWNRGNTWEEIKGNLLLEIRTGPICFFRIVCIKDSVLVFTDKAVTLHLVSKGARNKRLGRVSLPNSLWFPVIQWLQVAYITVVMYICDVIKQNQPEVGYIVFKIESNKVENVFCFLLFLASFNWSYFWNQLTNFNGVFCKM